jgi:MFS family permease
MAERLGGTVELTRQQLRTPRAAAIAGILFALLLGISLVLIRLAIPADPREGGAWLAERAGSVAFALNLVPFAGIAFLWFMGVLRDRIGDREDRFFATVFFGSGLLFLGMLFVAAALAGGMLLTFARIPLDAQERTLFAYGRATMYAVANVYAMKMAGVFMISTATIAARTGVMPRWLVVLSYAVALFFLLSVGFIPWAILLFPAWVLLVSVYMLVQNYRAG